MDYTDDTGKKVKLYRGTKIPLPAKHAKEFEKFGFVEIVKATPQSNKMGLGSQQNK
jgi:hypothetical protein